jgi:hypothetical protein
VRAVQLEQGHPLSSSLAGSPGGYVSSRSSGCR